MQLQIWQSRPGNLRQALEATVELESYVAASRRSRPVREVVLEGLESSPEECGEAKMLCQLECCVKALQFHSRAQKDRRNRVAQGPRARRREVCWTCGLPGYIQRNCSKPNTDVAPGAGRNEGPADRQDPGNNQYPYLQGRTWLQILKPQKYVLKLPYLF